jgi:hypothetical protein
VIYTFKVIRDYFPHDSNEEVKAGTIIEVKFPVSHYDEFIKDFDGILERYLDSPPAVVFDGKAFVADIQARQPEGFKEVLAKIGEAHPISPLADRYHKKSIKEGQTRAAVQKVKDKVKKEKKQIVYKNRTKFN